MLYLKNFPIHGITHVRHGVYKYISYQLEDFVLPLLAATEWLVLLVVSLKVDWLVLCMYM